MIALKRADPADDLLSALINAEDDGDVLDDEELIAQTLLLYVAGTRRRSTSSRAGPWRCCAIRPSARCSGTIPP